MADASDYLETALLNHVFRNTAMTSPAAVYVALFTADGAGETGTPGTEVVAGDGYARVEATFGAPSDDSGEMQVANSADVEFGKATADKGTVTHWCVMDAPTGGNPLTSPKAFATPWDYDTNVQPVFEAGNLTVNLG
ncbi:phage tail fiber protein [Gaopeijia maritima]|uniref:phage tail fiber protein n=1 Tax=Gaopeijia maritima TaxID=3119007 RepID=UPI003291C9B9